MVVMEEKNKNIFGKIVNILLNVFIFMFSIILLISIYNNIQVRVFNKDYSDFFGYSIFEVQTGSMAPEINPGDWIIVKASNSIELKDIVTYNKSGEYITHRVIGAYNGTYVTKGDANNSTDDPIDKKQIVGEVVKILPNLGILKKTIFNPVVLIAIIITISICNLVFKKSKTEEKTKKYQNINNVINTLKNIKQKTKQKRLVVKEKKQDKLKTKKDQLLEIVGEKKLKEEQIEILNELDDTSSYIYVDASELDDTLLEIAKNEISEAEPQIEAVKKIEVEEIEVEETPTKINLDLLESTKKSKNIIDKYISVKIEEINEIIEILNDSDKTFVNEPTIKNKLMAAYIEAKYYNYFGNVDVTTTKKQSLKINKYLVEVSSIMKKKYNGSDVKYNEKVDKYLNIFNVVTKLELAEEIITDRKVKEEFYKKELTKYAKVNNYSNLKIKEKLMNIMKIQRNYIGIVEYLLKKIETNVFELELSPLKTNKNIYAINLEHNISFSKVYSDYIIDKTYSEGVIAENKTIILLNLLSVEIIKDMMTSRFNKKYIVYIPKTLYLKEKKLERILKLIEDEKAKESITFLMDLESLVKFKTLVKKLKKEGYNFAIAINRETKLEEKYYNIMNVAEYIFVDKSIPNIVKTLSNLPEDLIDKLVYEDITQKIGDFGGE